MAGHLVFHRGIGYMEGKMASLTDGAEETGGLHAKDENYSSPLLLPKAIQEGSKVLT